MYILQWKCSDCRNNFPRFPVIHRLRPGESTLRRCRFHSDLSTTILSSAERTFIALTNYSITTVTHCCAGMTFLVLKYKISAGRSYPRWLCRWDAFAPNALLSDHSMKQSFTKPDPETVRNAGFFSLELYPFRENRFHFFKKGLKFRIKEKV